MAYNNVFPVGYQPYYPQYQQQYQQNTPQMTPQMTPPTIHAEIVQVDNEQMAENYPLAAGASQMMIAKDDSAIFVKSMYANGQYNLDVFTKRPQRPKTAEIDTSQYITRDEFETRLKEILREEKGVIDNGTVRSVGTAGTTKQGAD